MRSNRHQTTSNFPTNTTRLFKHQVILGDIWQLPPEGNTTGWSDRTGRIDSMVVMVIRKDRTTRTDGTDKSEGTERTDISDIKTGISRSLV